jgi:hypothetical protein
MEGSISIALLSSQQLAALHGHSRIISEVVKGRAAEVPPGAASFQTGPLKQPI